MTPRWGVRAAPDRAPQRESQVLPPQPRRGKSLWLAATFCIKKVTASLDGLPLLFRKKSRSARLLGCKRPRNGSLSLPTFCGLRACGASFLL